MRRFQCLVGLFAVVAFAGSCAHDDPSPTAPLQVEANLSAAVCRLLTDDFMDDEWAGSNRLGVERRIDHIRYLLKSNQQAQAQTEMFQLWDLVLKAYYAGKLPGGTSAAAQKRVLFIGQVLYCFVGLDATGLTLSDPSTGDLTQVVFPATTDQDLVHGSGNAGVRIYGSTLTAPVTISITAITTVFNPYAGPLNTPLDQYGPYFHFGAVPNITFPNPVLVEECLVGPTGNLPASVDLAHNVGTGVEILPKATDHLLTCTTIGQLGPSARELWDRGAFGKAFARLGSEALALIRPSVAWAGGSGVSGKPRNFSPFGGVDINVSMEATSSLTQGAAVGAAVASPPAVKVHTAAGKLLPGANVTFAVTAGGGTLAATAGGPQVTTVTSATDAKGAASVASWTLGATAGTNTVSAAGAFPAPILGINVVVLPSSILFGANGASPNFFGGNWTALAGDPARQMWLVQKDDGTVTGQITIRTGCVFNISGSVNGSTLSMPSWAFVPLTGGPVLQSSCAALSGSDALTATLSPDGQSLAVATYRDGVLSVNFTLARQALGRTVLVSPPLDTLVLGESLQLTAVVNDAAGNPVATPSIVWATSNPAAATVSATGLVTDVGPGTATITATSGGIVGAATILQPPAATLTVIDVTPGQIDRQIFAGVWAPYSSSPTFICYDINQNGSNAPSNQGDWSASLTNAYGQVNQCTPNRIGSASASLQSQAVGGKSLVTTGAASGFSGPQEIAEHIEYSNALDDRSFLLDNTSRYTLSGSVTVAASAAVRADSVTIWLVGAGGLVNGVTVFKLVELGQPGAGSKTYPFSQSGILPSGEYTLVVEAWTWAENCPGCSQSAAFNNVVLQLTP